MIPDIEYSLNNKLDICSDVEFLCVELAKGDFPQLRDPRLNFTVEGVAGEDDLTPARKSLRGCIKFPACRGMLLYCHSL